MLLYREAERHHNYPGNAISNEIRIFEEKIRDHAVSCNQATQRVIDNCLTNLFDNAASRILDFKHIKRNIQNQCETNDSPKIPHDRTFD